MSLRLSMKAKLTTLVVVIVTVSLWTFGRITLSGILEMITRSSGLGALTAASTLADTVDPAWMSTLAMETAAEDPSYNRLVTLMNKVVTNGHVKRVGLVRFRQTAEVQHIISLPVDNTADYFPPGRIMVDEPNGLYTQRKSGYHVWTMETPGTYMAGWVPVKHGNQTVGLLYIIADATDVQRVLDRVSIAVLSLMAAIILLSGLLAYKLSAAFEKTAVTDGLMGIYNHKYFKQRLEEEIAKSGRYGQQTSLVLMDIDFFKRVNDTYGHATGDLVLKTLAKIVTDTCRNTDVVARYGGEEVAVILPHTGIAGAQEFTERLRLKISHNVIRDPEEEAEFRVTVSAGVTQWEKGVSMLDMIKRADAALYHSKHSGRNRVTIYQDDILPAPEQPLVKSER